MAAFTAIALGVSAGLGIFNQVRGGKAEKKAGEAQRAAAEAQADLADWNANVADLQAADAITRGAEEEARFRQGVKGIIAAQRAGFAASNVDVSFGSSLDVQADAAYLGELDALTIRTNAAREAWGFKVEAEDLRQRGVIARQEGVMLERAAGERAKQAYVGAASTALGTATSLIGLRYGFGRTTGSAPRTNNPSVAR
jgi:hypothetical protein